MNPSLAAILFLISSNFCAAQNLVPNGSFEQYQDCPFGPAEFDGVAYWLNPTLASPDYFNACSVGPAGVPANIWGNQEAHSGDAYCGLGLWSYYAPYREFAEVSLTNALTAGQCYRIELYLSMPDDFIYATSSFGIYLSDTLITYPYTFPLPYTPQLTYANGLISDTSGWVLMSADYLAVGGERFLTLGNYNYDLQTDVVMVNGDSVLLNNFITWSYAMAYVDDVSLTPIACINAIEQPLADGQVCVWPNPFFNQLNIHTPDCETAEIILRDIGAREVLRQSFARSVILNTNGLNAGVYFYEIRTSGGVVYAHGKAVKG